MDSDENEKLKAENETLKAALHEKVDENEKLKAALQELRDENEKLKAAQYREDGENEKPEGTLLNKLFATSNQKVLNHWFKIVVV